MMSFLKANKSVLWTLFIIYAFILPFLFVVEYRSNESFKEALYCEVVQGQQNDCLLDMEKIHKYSNWISLAVPLIFIVSILESRNNPDDNNDNGKNA